MTFLQSVPASLIAHAAGWALLHFVWQGLLVAAILACLLAILPSKFATARYTAACTALVLMTVLPVITFARIFTAERVTTNRLSFEIAVRTVSLVGPFASQPAPALYRLIGILNRVMPSVVTLWLVGVVFFSSRLSYGLITVRRIVRAAKPCESREFLLAFDHVAHRLGLSIPVRVLQCGITQVPTVVGWIRPVILIPIGCFSGMSPMQIEAILAHEIAHILRRDYLFSVLQSVLEALFFYHPAVWWLSKIIRVEREHCCDDLAVECTGNALLYARALSLLEEHRGTLPVTALGANGGILFMRIKRILGGSKKTTPPQTMGLFILCLAVVFLATYVTSTGRVQAKELQGAQSVSRPTDATVKFAGTWHWMCNGKSVVTMILRPSGTGFTGSVSAIGGIQLDKDGTVLNIEPRAGTTPLSQSSLDGAVLRFKIKDEDETEWTMTLKEDGTARLQGKVPEGEGPAMKPIEAQKAR